VQVDDVVGLLRGVVFVSGALAAAGAVLAVYVLRRHRGARIGLTVTAALLVVVTTTIAGPLPLLVALAAAMLWGREAREWFAGPSERTATGAGVPAAGAPPSGSRAHQPVERPQPPVPPPGWQVPSRETGRPPWTQSWPPPVPGYGHDRSGQPTGAAVRPGAVTAAAVLTWVFCALAAAVFSMLVFSLVVLPDRLLEALQANPEVAALAPTRTQLLGALWVLSAVGIFWSLAAIALAVLAFRRVQVGRVALVVSSLLSGLVALLAAPTGLANAVAAFTAAGLLLGGSARRWYSRRQPPAGPFPGPPPTGPRYGGPPPPPPPGKPPVW
jgi:hypothetical protein